MIRTRSFTRDSRAWDWCRLRASSAGTRPPIPSVENVGSSARSFTHRYFRQESLDFVKTGGRWRTGSRSGVQQRREHRRSTTAVSQAEDLQFTVAASPAIGRLSGRQNACLSAGHGVKTALAPVEEGLKCLRVGNQATPALVDFQSRPEPLAFRRGSPLQCRKRSRRSGSLAG